MNGKRILLLILTLFFAWSKTIYPYCEANITPNTPTSPVIVEESDESENKAEDKYKLPFEGLTNDAAGIGETEDEEQKEEELSPEEKKFFDDIDGIVKKHIGNFTKNGGKGTIGIYIKDFNTGYEYDYNGSKVSDNYEGEGFFKTASTCKMTAAAVVYYLNFIGELDIDKEYTDLITGEKYNMKKLTYKMITHSVNGYFNTLFRHFGNAKMNEMFKQLGLKNTYVYSEIGPAPYMSEKSNIQRYGISRSPRTTPKDLGHVLELLHEGSTFGEENSKCFAESLKNNIYSNRLPKGIDYKSPVGHKTGTATADGVYNDAGIVYLKDNPYIIVVMSYGSQSSVQNVYHKISKDVYNYMFSKQPYM